MGEIAEMMLEGFLDEETGELIDGTAPGYPRRMSDAQRPDPAGKPGRSAKRRAQRRRAAARAAQEGQHRGETAVACGFHGAGGDSQHHPESQDKTNG